MPSKLSHPYPTFLFILKHVLLDLLLSFTSDFFFLGQILKLF